MPAKKNAKKQVKTAPKPKAKKAPKQKPEPKPKGRPSKFTDEVAEIIVDEIINGKSMVEICEREDMPHRSTVLKWMAADPDFSTCIARAREEQAEYMDHLILLQARNCTPENAAAARVAIAAYQWRASKLHSKKFGEKLDINATVETPAMTREDMIENMRKSPAYLAQIEAMVAEAKKPAKP